MVQASGVGIKRIKRRLIWPFIATAMIIAILTGRIYPTFAGGGVVDNQTTEVMESFTQADSSTYPSLGMGRFNTYAIYRVFGSNGAAYSSDIFNSITAGSGITSPYYPYITNTEIVNGKEVNSYVYDNQGKRIQSSEAWYYLGCLIPDDYNDLFDIAIASNGQVTFSPKSFNRCSNSSYGGGRYLAVDNSLGKVIDENLNSGNRYNYSATYPLCSCNNICGYISSGGNNRLSLSGYYDWNAVLCKQYGNHIKDGYVWMKVSWNTGVSSSLQKHYANYKHKFVLVDRRDWRWDYTSTDGGKMVILYSNWWTEGGISFTRDADSRYRALNEYVLKNYGVQYQNYFIITDFVTIQWDESNAMSGKQLEYNQNLVMGVKNVYSSIADVKQRVSSANFVTYMRDREVSGWTIRIGENAGAAITINIHLMDSATNNELAATSIGLNDGSILPGTSISRATILNNAAVTAAVSSLAGDKNYNYTYGNKMTAINTATDKTSTNLEAGNYKISSGINSYTTIDVYYRASAKPTNTPRPSPTNTSSPTPTNTNTPRPTYTSTPKPTNTSTPRPTNTPTPTNSNTPTPTNTNTPTPTNTNTPTPTNTNTPTPTNTNTPTPTNTNTPTPTNTNTPTPTNTNTPTPTNTNTPTPTNTNTPTPQLQVTDIKVNNSSRLTYDATGKPIIKQGNKLDYFTRLKPYGVISSIRAIPHYYYDDGSGMVEALLFTTVTETGGTVTLRQAGLDYSDILIGQNTANGSAFTYVFPYTSYVLAKSDYNTYLEYKKNNTISGQEPFFKKEGYLLIIYDFQVVTTGRTLYYYKAFTVRVVLSNGSTWIH